MKRLVKGFTMIELLIVIAVLGVLAVAVLSALNPIEQINRGKDTGTRSDAEQLLSAIDRFYAAKAYYPWQTGTTDDAKDFTALTQITSAAPIQFTGCPMLDALADGTVTAGCVGSKELKASFITRVTGTSANPLFIYYDSETGAEVSNSVYLCFAPKSGSFKTEASDRCTDANGFGDDIDETLVCGVGTPPVNYSCLP